MIEHNVVSPPVKSSLSRRWTPIIFRRIREHRYMATAPKSTAKKASKGFEETLWDTANQLRGSVESSEYKHVVLSWYS